MTLSAAVEALSRGLVVGVPTDTVYGLAVDPTNAGAVERLFGLKGRHDEAPLIVLVASLSQAGTLAELSEAYSVIIGPHWPGGLTAILPTRSVFAPGVGDRRAATLGLRVPDQPQLIELLVAFGPLAVSSANRSGSAPALSSTEAQAIFGAEVPVYVEGTCPGGVASTVVDFTADPPVVLRPGPVDLDGVLSV